MAILQGGDRFMTSTLYWDPNIQKVQFYIGKYFIYLHIIYIPPASKTCYTKEKVIILYTWLILEAQ